MVSPAATLRTPHRLLVVDDETPILFALKDYFTRFGYEVDGARELEEAKALLVNHPYSLVIADMRLTGIGGAEGLEMVGFVRERFPSTRIILLTAYGSTEIENEALKLGVDAFLHKPTPLSEVAQIVFGLLGDAA
ncbi:MAG: hypothetical protein NVSMB56_10750 [Pyrinomonadaceae bacterium]